MKKVLSFDIGGTKIAYAVIAENGEIISEINKIETPATSVEICEFFKQTIKQKYNDFDGVAFSSAGAVNNEGTAITSFVGNLPPEYNKTDFKSLTDKPILVENDANSMAWAEYSLGAAQGSHNAIVVAIGTGIGSGIIVDGKLLKGKSGAAGEMHFPVDTGHKRRCQGCGMYDCFESFASGTGLKVSAQKVWGPDATTYTVIEGKKQGNAEALRVFEDWQDYLVRGMIMLGNIFDPEKIVLSGSMAQFVEYDKVEKAVNDAILTQPLQICPAHFANNAGMIGAGLLLLGKL